MTEKNWRTLALCQTEDPEMWFSDERVVVMEAKRICSGCPVRFECLTDAMRFEGTRPPGSRFGVFGGLDESERYRAYRRGEYRHGRWVAA